MFYPQSMVDPYHCLAHARDGCASVERRPRQCSGREWNISNCRNRSTVSNPICRSRYLRRRQSCLAAIDFHDSRRIGEQMSTTSKNRFLRNINRFASTCLLFLLILGCASSPPPGVDRASKGQQLKSILGTTQARITFANKSGQRVKVYWLDYSGNLVFYKALEAGESYDQETYFTHPWLVTDANNTPWKTYLATSDHTVVDIISPEK